MRFHFNFRSNYQGRSDFDVFDRETGKEVRLNFYPATGAARFMFDQVPTDMLEAFNAWRLAKYESDCALILAKYGAEELANVDAFVPAVAAG